MGRDHTKRGAAAASGPSAKGREFRNRIVQGDCVKALGAVPDASVDVIFADPPYNLQLGGELLRPNNTRGDGVDTEWDRFDGFRTYDAFTRGWLSEAKRVLKPDGTLWVIGSYHNIFRVGAILQDLGFWILNDVIWRKSNPMPNFRGRRFTNAHETLIWAARDKESKYRFNYDSMKAHPTQKPESLLHRVILASSEVGDLILDPFFGTGTTGAVAKRLGRDFLGIEQDPDYVALARERVSKVRKAADDSFLDSPAKREQPRVPFGWLVEKGPLRPGQTLTDARRRHSARVRADGTLISADFRGSIHQVGAYVQKAPACNGWQFWCVEDKGELVPIDIYRQKLRVEMH